MEGLIADDVFKDRWKDENLCFLHCVAESDLQLSESGSESD